MAEKLFHEALEHWYNAPDDSPTEKELYQIWQAAMVRLGYLKALREAWAN